MLHLTQTQKLQQKLSPAQVQYLKILQLPVLALEQKIKDELELNPLLEEGMEQEDEQEENQDLQAKEREDDTDDTDDALNTDSPQEEFIEKEIRENQEEEYSWDEFFENNEGHASVNYYDNEDDREIPIPSSSTLRERLLEQVTMLAFSEDERSLAEAILWNIDDDGYLRRDLGEIQFELGQERGIDLTPEQAEEVISRLHRLDPPGIASRSLQECLIVQLEMMRDNSIERIIALRILRESYDEFVKKHFDKIEQDLHISRELLRRSFNLIRSLSPKPGESDAITDTNYLIPDFFVTREDEDFLVTLNDRGVPPLKVSRAYRELLQKRGRGLNTETRQFLRQKMEAAKWFIQSIHQRRHTMMNVMTTIVGKQHDWFDKGKGHLKPLIYKDIADEIEMDISTISRVVNGKYVQTEWGVYELRFFFSEGIPTASGEDISNREVKRIIKEMVDVENPRRPLSDEAIMKVLNERGFDIARRTVAKYRESMGIPVSRLRKQLT